MWFIQQRAERITPRRRTPRKKPAAKRKRRKAQKRKWAWDGLTVFSFTKSEARAEFKRMRGLSRLPVGARVEEA